MNIKNKKIILLGILVLTLFFTWIRGGFNSISLDTDLSRDLTQLSELWLHRMVWLGPRLSIQTNTSPIYYYFFYPGLIISHGDVRSIFLTNMILSATVLFCFGLILVKQKRLETLIALVTLGLSPFWQSNSIHPSNGGTYIFWVFLSLVTLYTEISLFWCGLFLGLAIANHPVSALVLPIFIYECWRRKLKLSEFLLVILAFLIPWTPLIIFEVVTKAYVTRQFLENHTINLWFEFSTYAINQMSFWSGINSILLLLLWILVGFMSKGRLRKWFYLTSLSLIFLFFTGGLLPHYVLSVLCAMWFISSLVLIRSKFGLVLLSLGAIYFIINIISHPLLPADRNVGQVENAVNNLINSGSIENSQKIAVLAALKSGTLVPQADDYRFFLRVKGYDVLNVQQYSQADTLVEFIEKPNFDYQSWQTWETNQIGDRSLERVINSNGIKIIVYKKD